MNNPSFCLSFWRAFKATPVIAIIAFSFLGIGTVFAQDSSERSGISFEIGQGDDPYVARAPGGDFIVVWNPPAGADNNIRRTGRFTIQRYDANANPVGAPIDYGIDARALGVNFRFLNTAKIAMADDGRFVVVAGNDNNLPGNQRFNRARVAVQTFSADGTPDGEPFLVGRRVVDFNVGMDATGGFVVSWTSFARPLRFNFRMQPILRILDVVDFQSIHFQRFAANGEPVHAPRLATSRIGVLPDSLFSQAPYDMTTRADGAFDLAFRSGLVRPASIYTKSYNAKSISSNLLQRTVERNTPARRLGAPAIGSARNGERFVVGYLSGPRDAALTDYSLRVFESASQTPGPIMKQDFNIEENGQSIGLSVRNARIEMANNGSFALTFTHNERIDDTTIRAYLFAQRYDAQAQPVGDLKRLEPFIDPQLGGETAISGVQTAGDGNGDIVAAYTQTGPGIENTVRATLYSANVD